MDYSTKTRKELLAHCKEKGLRGYTNKNKDELVQLLLAAPASAPPGLTQITPINTIVLSSKTSKSKNKSPLRYPGGKTRAIPILEKYVQTHYIDKKILLSPFFGGGSFELASKSKFSKVYGNDLFKPLYTFWKVLQSNKDELLKRIRSKMPVTKESFQAMRASILTIDDPVVQAAAYFCINRSSFSGATLCGGFSIQAAEHRLTESSLQTLQECNVSEIEFSNMDCITFLETHPQNESTLIYADPPYYIETYIYGKDGDMHESFNHAGFATAIQKRNDWILSYNDCEYIRNLYKNCRIFTESWSYGMNASKKSSEIIILPPL
jgi:DNA adenine methylase